MASLVACRGSSCALTRFYHVDHDGLLLCLERRQSDFLRLLVHDSMFHFVDSLAQRID